MRALSLICCGLLGLNACKTVSFKGDTGTKTGTPTTNGTPTTSTADKIPVPVVPPVTETPTSTTPSPAPTTDTAGNTTTTNPGTTTTTPDGSTTTAGPDGTATATTKNPDGTSTTVTTYPDGTKTTTVTTTKRDGTITMVTTNRDGTTTTKVTNPPGTGNPPSPPETPPVQPPTPTNPNVPFVDCPENPSSMLVAKLYEIPAQSSKIPDFTKVKYKKDVCLKQLDVTDRQFTEGFPGIPGLVEWFALDINWKVTIPESGKYTLFLNSDDGARLYIDGIEVIDNDGLHDHKELSRVADIPKGVHAFHVTYYQGPRYRIALELKWQRPGANSREYIPVQYFARP